MSQAAENRDIAESFRNSAQRSIPEFVFVYEHTGEEAEIRFENVTIRTPLDKIKLIEKKIGRLKTKKNDPRVCDIDIIDFKGLILKKKKLRTPHPKMHLRNFVLYPLREIEPNWTHPVFNKKIDYFLKQLNLKSHIEITRLKKSVIL